MLGTVMKSPAVFMDFAAAVLSSAAAARISAGFFSASRRPSARALAWALRIRIHFDRFRFCPGAGSPTALAAASLALSSAIEVSARTLYLLVINFSPTPHQ